MSALVFWVLAFLACAGGILVFRFDSMARATFALLLSFLATGGLLVSLGLDYLGVVVVLMMVMEMVIMAVFMVAYMMNPGGLMPMAMTHNKSGALVIAIATFALFGIGIFLVDWPHRTGARPADATLQLGTALMGRHMLTMVVLGFVLLATMVGSVVLATQRGRYDRFGDDLRSTAASDTTRRGAAR